MSNLLPKSVTGECAVRWKDGGGGCPFCRSVLLSAEKMDTHCTPLRASGPMRGDDPAAEAEAETGGVRMQCGKKAGVKRVIEQKEQRREEEFMAGQLRLR